MKMVIFTLILLMTVPLSVAVGTKDMMEARHNFVLCFVLLILFCLPCGYYMYNYLQGK